MVSIEKFSFLEVHANIHECLKQHEKDNGQFSTKGNVDKTSQSKTNEYREMNWYDPAPCEKCELMKVFHFVPKDFGINKRAQTV